MKGEKFNPHARQGIENSFSCESQPELHERINALIIMTSKVSILASQIEPDRHLGTYRLRNVLLTIQHVMRLLLFIKKGFSLTDLII